MDRVLAYLEVNQLAFLNICITTGCDYLPNVKGVGINKAKKLVKENDFLHHLIRIPGAPEGYENQFVSARAIFQHQTIINPDNLTTMPINIWNETFDDDKRQTCKSAVERILSRLYGSMQCVTIND